MHDAIIRGGTIYDGGGSAPAVGDVAIKDGVIVAAGGRISEAARLEIDAIPGARRIAPPHPPQPFRHKGSGPGRSVRIQVTGRPRPRAR